MRIPATTWLAACAKAVGGEFLVTLMAEENGEVTSTTCDPYSSLQWYRPTYGQSSMPSWIGCIQQHLQFWVTFPGWAGSGNQTIQ